MASNVSKYVFLSCAGWLGLCAAVMIGRIHVSQEILAIDMFTALKSLRAGAQSQTCSTIVTTVSVYGDRLQVMLYRKAIQCLFVLQYTLKTKKQDYLNCNVIMC